MITKINRGLCTFFVWSMHLNFLSRSFVNFLHPSLQRSGNPPLGCRRVKQQKTYLPTIHASIIPVSTRPSNLGTCSRVLLIESFALLFCHVTTLSHAVLRVRLKELGPCDVAVRLPAVLIFPYLSILYTPTLRSWWSRHQQQPYCKLDDHLRSRARTRISISSFAVFWLLAVVILSFDLRVIARLWANQPIGTLRGIQLPATTTLTGEDSTATSPHPTKHQTRLCRSRQACTTRIGATKLVGCRTAARGSV